MFYTHDRTTLKFYRFYDITDLAVGVVFTSTTLAVATTGVVPFAGWTMTTVLFY
jgi:hypothetical protein